MTELIIKDTVFPAAVQSWLDTLGEIENVNIEFEVLPDGVSYDKSGHEWFHHKRGEHVVVTAMEPDREKHTKVFLIQGVPPKVIWSEITPDHAATCYYELCQETTHSEQIPYDVAELFLDKPGD